MSKDAPLWGKYTWYLFHWFAENIKEEYFQEEREKLIRIIKNIIMNLPCPSCQGHALEYLKKKPLERIQTKEHLRSYLFIFHNAVSQRGRKKIYEMDILEQYKKVNIKILVDTWLNVFSGGNHVRQDNFMLKGNIQRVKNETVAYIKNNYNKFV